jgi:hypothetical protein
LPVSLDSLSSLDADSADSRDTLLYLGNLPLLDQLLALLIPRWRLRDVIQEAVQLLRDRVMAARIVATVREVRESPANRVIVFSEHGLPSWGRDLEVVTLAQLAGADDTPAANGATAANETMAASTAATPSAGDTAFRFQITAEQRQRYVAKLKSSPTPFLVSDPFLMAQLKLLTREGAWQEALFPEPLLAITHLLRAPAGGQKT